MHERSKTGFWALFWTQFLGAFNDNAFKNALMILITYRAIELAGMSSQVLVAFCGGLFILPFFLFSSLAGQLAAKLEKAVLIRWIKAFEIVLMLATAIGLFFDRFSILVVLLFAMGMQSAFFGPIKYSILPELLSTKELVKGNALVNLGTFLAILLGTIAGGLGSSFGPDMENALGLALVCFAIFGFFTASRVPRTGPSAPHLIIDWNPFRPMYKMHKMLLEHRDVYLGILGISWFWFVGAALLTLLPIYSRDVLYGQEQLVTLFLALFTLGVGMGSMLCEKLSFRRMEIGLVPLGSLGLTLAMFDLFLIAKPWDHLELTVASIGIADFYGLPNAWRISLDLFLLAVFGGFQIVPLYTLVQARSPRHERAQAIAANNIINALFMVASAVAVMFFFRQNLSIPSMFGIFAAMNVAVSIFIYFEIPEFTLRFIAWMVAHLLYRVRFHGADHIPDKGPALIICNHVSFVDWLIIGGLCQRPIRFVMHHGFFNIPIAKYLFKHAKVIPIASRKENPELMDRAFDQVSQELQNGQLVCIFPEGKLTRDGKMDVFKPGVLKILERDPVPVVPMALKGLWGSLFSHRRGGKIFNRSSRLWKPVTLNCGEVVDPKDVSLKGLEARVANLLDV